MPWAADEPKPVEEKAELLRFFRGRFDLGEDFVYGIFARDESEVVGGTGLHTRVGAAALEIGYWIRASQVRKGYAREVAAALTRVAFRVCGVDRVEIRVDPGNAASLRVPRVLGFAEEATLRRRLPSKARAGRSATPWSSRSLPTSSRPAPSRTWPSTPTTCSAARSRPEPGAPPLPLRADVERPRHSRGHRPRFRPGRLAPRSPSPQGGAHPGRPLRQGPRPRDPRQGAQPADGAHDVVGSARDRRRRDPGADDAAPRGAQGVPAAPDPRHAHARRLPRGAARPPDPGDRRRPARR